MRGCSLREGVRCARVFVVRGCSLCEGVRCAWRASSRYIYNCEVCLNIHEQSSTAADTTTTATSAVSLAVSFVPA